MGKTAETKGLDHGLRQTSLGDEYLLRTQTVGLHQISSGHQTRDKPELGGNYVEGCPWFLRESVIEGAFMFTAVLTGGDAIRAEQRKRRHKHDIVI